MSIFSKLFKPTPTPRGFEVVVSFDELSKSDLIVLVNQLSANVDELTIKLAEANDIIKSYDDAWDDAEYP